jgi:hypothetical protein
VSKSDKKRVSGALFNPQSRYGIELLIEQSSGVFISLVWMAVILVLTGFVGFCKFPFKKLAQVCGINNS